MGKSQTMKIYARASVTWEHRVIHSSSTATAMPVGTSLQRKTKLCISVLQRLFDSYLKMIGHYSNKPPKAEILLKHDLGQSVSLYK